MTSPAPSPNVPQQVPQLPGPRADPSDALRHFIGYRIHLLDSLLGQSANQVTRRAAGMNRAEWYVILHLGLGHCASPHEIANQTGMERSQITVAVRALVERGLVVTSRDQRDGRRLKLTVTKKGRQLLAKGIEAHAPRRAILDEALSHEERVSFDRMLTKLLHVAAGLLEQSGDEKLTRR